MSCAYEQGMAAFACTSDHSRGRHYTEDESPYRNVFQRDRDRIIHSNAFRRLEYKTQVFVNHEGDHYRTRLTHSIEVAQIARSICRALQLHEDLAEAVALAHDLGHTPFGHSGQDALNKLMQPFGGFEHNRQSLRVVEKLELRYAAFPGLNLSYETREGIVKHRSLHDKTKSNDLAEYVLHEQPTLEAQVANLADEIAYNNHDVDDGIRADILDFESLREVELFRTAYAEVEDRYPGINRSLVVHEIVRRMVSTLISDVIEESRRRLSQAGVSSLDDVRASSLPLIGFSAEVRRHNIQLKRYLYRHMYKHYRVVRMAAKAEKVVGELFEALMRRPAMLPPRQKQMHDAADDDAVRARVIADYIAGMTDRYALEEYHRLFDVNARS
ncbi:MAG: deoxyguanosinetriphosphate triphosphohydrolase [Mariprofundaceae bacterium]